MNPEVCQDGKGSSVVLGLVIEPPVPEAVSHLPAAEKEAWSRGI